MLKHIKLIVVLTVIVALILIILLFISPVGEVNITMLIAIGELIAILAILLASIALNSYIDRYINSRDIHKKDTNSKNLLT